MATRTEPSPGGPDSSHTLTADLNQKWLVFWPALQFEFVLPW